MFCDKCGGPLDEQSHTFIEDHEVYTTQVNLCRRCIEGIDRLIKRILSQEKGD